MVGHVEALDHISSGLRICSCSEGHQVSTRWGQCSDLSNIGKLYKTLPPYNQKV